MDLNSIPFAVIDWIEVLWKYEVSYSFGRTVGTEINQGNLIRPNVAEALRGCRAATTARQTALAAVHGPLLTRW